MQARRERDMTEAVDDGGKPIDLVVIWMRRANRARSARRHALYLRETQRLVVDGLVPDGSGWPTGSEPRPPATCSRILGRSPTLEPAVTAADARSLAALKEIVAAAPAPEPVKRRPPRPVRLALQPSATIVDSMAVRKRPTAEGLELSWDSRRT
jgi:hypothetical protein